MNMNAKDLQRMSLEEFEAMEKDERLNYELIDGIVMMSPSPNFEHQAISSNLVIALGIILRETTCKVLFEYDIKFQGDIFKPDIIVFCRNQDEMPPEIIAEILSPSTRQRDLLVKLVKYQAMGIKEYWIVDPKMKSITVHDFINQSAETYGIGETIYSKAIPKIVIAVADIFA